MVNEGIQWVVLEGSGSAHRLTLLCVNAQSDDNLQWVLIRRGLALPTG
jgi:hypothetical protein